MHILLFQKEFLQKVSSISDLYVHTADVEIEAISCIEAFSSGLVPVIANSYYCLQSIEVNKRINLYGCWLLLCVAVGSKFHSHTRVLKRID